jgi:hypothetical protein
MKYGSMLLQCDRNNTHAIAALYQSKECWEDLLQRYPSDKIMQENLALVDNILNGSNGN